MPHYQFDAFLSYSHEDNDMTGGSILKLAKNIEEAFDAHFKIDQNIGKFRIFTDSANIPKGADWERAIREKLESSRMFLMIISPAYFKRKECIKEYTYWCEIERQMGLTPKLIVPIYYMKLPDDLELNADGVLAKNEAFRRQHFDFVGNKRVDDAQTNAWNTTDSASMLGSIPVVMLADLLETICSRRFLLEKASNSPDLTELAINNRFTEHYDSLYEIYRAITNIGTHAVVLHGLCGSGKTELARTYTQSYASEYSEGRFYCDCTGLKTMDDAVLKLARDPDVARELKLKIPAANAHNPDALVTRMIEALSTGKPSSKLLFLDNVDNPGFFTKKFIENTRIRNSRLHILATTSLGCGLRKDICTIPVKPLSDQEGAALFNAYRECRNEDDWKHAGQMAHALGGHAWSIDLLGSCLGAHDSLSYAGYAASVNKSLLHVLDQAGRDKTIDIRHPARSLDDLFGPTLRALPEVARHTLVAASALPADLVDLDWLHDVVEQKYKDALKYEDQEDNLNPHPWTDSTEGIIMPLVRQGFLSIPGKDVKNQGITATMPRVLHAYLRARNNAILPEIADAFHQVMMLRAGVYYDHPAHATSKEGADELHSIIACAIAWLDMDAPCRDHACELLLDKLEPILANLGDSARRHKLLADTADRLGRNTTKTNGPAHQKQLAQALCLLADSSLALGDHTLAGKQAGQSLSLWKSLLDTPGPDMQKLARIKIAETSLTLGKAHQCEPAFDKAREALQTGLDILQDTPPDPDCLHMQARIQTQLGSLWSNHDTPEAIAHYQKALDIAQSIDGDNPGQVKWQQLLAASHDNMASILKQGKDTELDVLAHYRQSLDLYEFINSQEPNNTEHLRALAISRDNIAGQYLLLDQKPNAPEYCKNEALDHYKEGLAAREELHALDSEGAAWPDNPAISHEYVADTCALMEDYPEALQHYQSRLQLIQEQIDRKNQNGEPDAEEQHLAAMTHKKIAQTHDHLDAPDDAADHYRQSRDILSTICAANPDRQDWRMDLFHVQRDSADRLVKQEKQDEVLQYYNDALATLAMVSPATPADLERVLNHALEVHRAAAAICEDAPDGLESAAGHYQACVEHCAKLVHHLKIDSSKFDLAKSYFQLANTRSNQGRAMDALKSYDNAVKIFQQLAAGNPAEPQDERNVLVVYNKMLSLHDIPANDIMPCYKGMLASYERFRRLPAPQSEKDEFRAMITRRLDNADSADSLPRAWNLHCSDTGSNAPSPKWLKDLARLYQLAGELYEESDAKEDKEKSRPFFRWSMLRLRNLYEKPPNDKGEDFRSLYYSSLQRLAHFHVMRGEFKEAWEHIKVAFQIAEKPLAAGQSALVVDSAIAGDIIAVANWLKESRSFDNARSLLEETMLIMRNMKARPNDEEWRKIKNDLQAALDSSSTPEPAKPGLPNARMEEIRLPNVTFRREPSEEGLDDPCPCGSGKKFKNCHGKM